MDCQAECQVATWHHGSCLKSCSACCQERTAACRPAGALCSGRGCLIGTCFKPTSRITSCSRSNVQENLDQQLGGCGRLLHCLRCTSACHVVQTAAEEVSCFKRGHHASHYSCGGACCSLLQNNLTSDWLLADPQDGNTCTLQWARVHCCTLCGHLRQFLCEPWHWFPLLSLGTVAKLSQCSTQEWKQSSQHELNSDARDSHLLMSLKSTHLSESFRQVAFSAHNPTSPDTSIPHFSSTPIPLSGCRRAPALDLRPQAGSPEGALPASKPP